MELFSSNDLNLNDLQLSFTWRKWNYLDFRDFFVEQSGIDGYMSYLIEKLKNPKRYLLSDNLIDDKNVTLMYYFKSALLKFYSDNQTTIKLVEQSLSEFIETLTDNVWEEQTSQSLIDIEEAILTCQERSLYAELDSKQKLLSRGDLDLLSNVLRLSYTTCIPAPLVYLNKDNKYVLLDGNHRYTIAKAYGIPIKAQVINQTSLLGKFFE